MVNSLQLFSQKRPIVDILQDGKYTSIIYISAYIPASKSTIESLEKGVKFV